MKGELFIDEVERLAFKTEGGRVLTFDNERSLLVIYGEVLAERRLGRAVTPEEVKQELIGMLNLPVTG